MLKNSKQRWAMFSLLLIAFLFSGCANHLKKGWECYDKGDYSCAQTEWSQEKKPEAAELVEQAKAAANIKRYYKDIQYAEKNKDENDAYSSSKKLLAENKSSWTDKQWLERSPSTVKYLAYARKVYNRIDNLKRKRELQAKKARKLQKQFNAKLKCGKDNLLNEKYAESKACLKAASDISTKNPDFKFNTEDVEYFTKATNQAIKIQEEIEAERQKKLAEEQRIEAERRRKAEEAIRVAEKKWIKAEAIRLKKLEAKRRKEAEIKRKKDLAAKRWKKFLAKGRLLRPLVATVGIPSKGKGFMKKYKAQRWQGGAQLPRARDRSLAPEDIYALGIIIPSGYKLNYLKNYYRGKQNLLQMPQTQGGSRHYYTEGYKGGRFYTELSRTKKGSKKYGIKAILYKIPVTN
ncbi:MAG: hypothetical protein GY714_21160 [Desulfobacterales bacterium]|nr:hypothetical protein [Desulfobacterales bacterium]MCP4159277.1 hypothetical protein [Deltaproteobacteria bacterium]